MKVNRDKPSRGRIAAGLATATLAAAAALLAACGGEDGRDGVRVVATTGVLAEIAAEVAGPDAEVAQLIPEGVDVHGFAASAKDRQDLEEATLVIENGAGLEAGVPLEEVSAPRWALAENGGELLETSEGTVDPHAWMSPAFVAAALPSLAEALAEADPENAAGYRMRAGDLASDLDRLDEELTAELAAIPDERRSLVTSHDALGYLADRYDLRVIATPFGASGPEAEPSAARLDEVERAVEAAGVPAVFAQASDDPEVLESVARATGVEVVDDLLVAAPGEAGSYAEMLRRDAALIASALG